MRSWIGRSPGLTNDEWQFQIGFRILGRWPSVIIDMSWKQEVSDSNNNNKRCANKSLSQYFIVISCTHKLTTFSYFQMAYFGERAHECGPLIFLEEQIVWYQFPSGCLLVFSNISHLHCFRSPASCSLPACQSVILLSSLWSCSSFTTYGVPSTEYVRMGDDSRLSLWLKCYRQRHSMKRSTSPEGERTSNIAPIHCCLLSSAADKKILKQTCNTQPTNLPRVLPRESEIASFEWCQLQQQNLHCSSQHGGQEME